MNFNNYFWPDSDLEHISIEYDHAILTITNFALRKRFLVHCTGLAGITNLCIWDDTIIFSTDVISAANVEDDFLRELYSVYDKNFNYGERYLSDGLWILDIELVNNTHFRVYCQDINVVESEDQSALPLGYIAISP